MTLFSIQSFGCRVNQAESFSWADELQKHGLCYENDYNQSDLILVNTCTLTSRADSDVKSFIKKVSRGNPRGRMVITGCFAERAEEELRDIPQIWRIFPNREKNTITERILAQFGSEKEISVRPYRSRALIKIQDGCDFKCTFCIIPSVRKRSVSVEEEKILTHTRDFIQQGFREIVFTGVHLCLYGRELKPRKYLVELLRKLEGLDGLGRIRLSSLDPRFLEGPLLEHITSSRKICPHFHLSLQHASDRIIFRMGRKITSSDYSEILTYLRQRLPLASLGADVIVGFPGETDADFEETFRFLEHSPLTYFHVFSFSPRPGTIASSWPQVEDKVKSERSALLRKLSKEKNMRFRRFFLGRELDAVVIKKEKRGAQVLTSNYLSVFVPRCFAEGKSEVKVRIANVTKNETTGRVVSP